MKVNTNTGFIYHSSLSIGTGVKSVLKILRLVMEAKPYSMMLIDEIINCANMVQTVTDEHDWLNRIIERMNQDRKITLYQIFEQVSKHESWSTYTKDIRKWLEDKQIKLHLN